MLKNDQVINNIKVTMAVEDEFIDNNDINLINMYLNNEITENQGVEKIKNDILSRII